MGFVGVVFVVNGCCRFCQQLTPVEYQVSRSRQLQLKSSCCSGHTPRNLRIRAELAYVTPNSHQKQLWHFCLVYVEQCLNPLLHLIHFQSVHANIARWNRYLCEHLKKNGDTNPFLPVYDSSFAMCKKLTKKIKPNSWYYRKVHHCTIMSAGSTSLGQIRNKQQAT